MKLETIISPPIATNTYIIYTEKGGKALIIDPFDPEAVSQFIEKYRLRIDLLILTHEHYDHIAGVNQLRSKYRCKLAASEKCSFMIQNENLNLSKYFDCLLFTHLKHPTGNIITKPYKCSPADITFIDTKAINWEGLHIELYETPGHSKGSICVYIDNKWLFTGDSLLRDVEVITRLPGGCSKSYREKTVPLLKKFKSDTQVFSGHGPGFMLNQRISVDGSLTGI